MTETDFFIILRYFAVYKLIIYYNFMKIKHLILGMLAVAAAVACEDGTDLETPELKVEETSLEVPAVSGTVTFTVTSNQDWEIACDAEWIASIEPSSGKASSEPVTVTVTASDNTVSEPRSAELTVKAGELSEKVTVTQAAGEVTPPADFDIDGKQWTFAWQGMGGASCVIDLGVTEPGVAILAYDMGVMDPSYAGIYYPYMMGTYTIAKTDGTSGVVTLSADGMSVEIPYSNATENSVHFATAALLDEDVDCTLAASFIEIYTEAAQGLADGEYWIIADNKVATPLTGNYGYLNVVDAVDGKSTAANAFTFTQVEAGVYTIQDSNGKYYYQTGEYNSFNVADKDGGTDEYLWEVYDSGNGKFVIMNYEVGKFMQYNPQYNSFGSYLDETGTLPTLVLAEDPIAEPEPTPGENEKFATNVTCTTVSSAYTDGVATVNGVANVFTLKLGTSKLYGEAKITLPKGTTKVSCYAVGWKSNPSKLEFSVGGTVIGTQEIAANDGATGNSPYTINVTDSDHYTLTLAAALEADTEVTVKTVEKGYRAILFGMQAE